ncbi:MAG: hypothetical protein Q4Q07_01915 [Tissierellia bacterium]|nr:hypothetical protein [Tissierellia bacterium]
MSKSFLFIEGIPCEVLKYAQEREKQTSAVGVNAILRVDRGSVMEIKKRIQGKDYFKVTLPDEYQTKIDMRFGKILWNYDGNLYTARVALVENTYDSISQVTVFDYLEPELTNTRIQCAKTSAYVVALENILIAKNILNSSDLEIIRKSVENLEKLKMKELYHVDNVYDYWEF